MISLIHPSRGRPEKSSVNYARWIDLASSYKIELILSLDYDDPLINKYNQCYERLTRDDHENDYPVHILLNNNRSVVDATNMAADKSKGDILVYLSDDFDCPRKWNDLIIDRIGDTSKPVMLKVDDCLQNFNVGVLTIPIMTRALYQMLGYFYHPAYKSMHVDVDLFEVCNKLGVIKNAPDLKFPHNHVSNGKAQDDDTYRRSAANWDQGLQVINNRRKQGFPIL